MGIGKHFKGLKVLKSTRLLKLIEGEIMKSWSFKMIP